MSIINDALMPASNQTTDGRPTGDGDARSASPAVTGSASTDGNTAITTDATTGASTDDRAGDDMTVTGTTAAAIASASATRTPRDHRPDDAHSTGVGDAGRWSTRRIAMYALFVALSMAVSFIEFPLMPAAPWLKYDPSGVVCLVAGFAFGPSAAAIVSVLGFLPHLFTNPWGTLMSVLVALALSVPAALIYRRRRTRASALVGILVGALFALVVVLGANLVITPMYAHMSMADVAKLIVPVLLPFNLIKFALNGVITFLVYKPISTLLNRGQQ